MHWKPPDRRSQSTPHAPGVEIRGRFVELREASEEPLLSLRQREPPVQPLRPALPPPKAAAPPPGCPLSTHRQPRGVSCCPAHRVTHPHAFGDDTHGSHHSDHLASHLFPCPLHPITDLVSVSVARQPLRVASSLARSPHHLKIGRDGAPSWRQVGCFPPSIRAVMASRNALLVLCPVCALDLRPCHHRDPALQEPSPRSTSSGSLILLKRHDSSAQPVGKG